MKLFSLYFQLLWNHLTYVFAVTEPERFHSKLGVTYFHLGDFPRAIGHLKKSEKQRHRDDRAFARYNAYYLGVSLMYVGECAEAIGYLDEYLRRKPDDEYIRECLSWCRSQLESTEQMSNCA